MKRRFKTSLAGGLLALALFGAARAGPLEDGQTAFDHDDYQTALLLWRPLADRGDAKAQTCLGLMYGNGYGVPQDDAEARKWYRRAADQGDGKAQYLLATIYEDGEGVPKDTAEAVKWYRKAAEGGFLAAQSHLGLVYYGGEDVPQNYAEAAKWFRRAADRGYASAQSMLGVMYAFGQGVPQDYIAAHMWSNLSAAQGNYKAAELGEFLATQMTPAQIVMAQRLAAEWKPNSVATSRVDAQKTLPDRPKQLEATHSTSKDCSGMPMEDWTLDCALPPKADNAPVSDLDNPECWRDASRQDITCRALTEEFLTSLRWATRPKIVKAMNVKGLEREDGRLHFDSNYSRVSTFTITGWGSGVVEFLFDDAGQAYVIHAIVFGPNIVHGPYSDRNAEYLWNGKSLPTGCSDLPQSKLPRCNEAR